MPVKAIYPGTFDPITNGHLDIIKRSHLIFNHLIVAVAEDSNKSPIFSSEERKIMIEQEISSINASNIEVIVFSGLLVEFARKHQAKIIIRGIRAASDFEYEFQMAYMNHQIASELETILIPATEKGHFISSKFVKEFARLGQRVDKFVSPYVAQKLYTYFKTLHKNF